MPLVTQRQAIELLKATGRSEAWRKATAKRLAKTRDGSRMKIQDRDLDALIRAENNPRSPTITNGLRGISTRKAQRIREQAI